MRSLALLLAGTLALRASAGEGPGEGPRGASKRAEPPPRASDLPVRAEIIRKWIAATSDATRGGLRLGPFARPLSPSEYEAPPPTPEGLRFESYIEVYGMTLEQRLQTFLKDFDLRYGPATRGAPTVEEMRDYRPGLPPSANLLPVLEWLARQLKKR